MDSELLKLNISFLLLTLISIFFTYKFRDNYKNWDEQTWAMKSILSSFAISSVITILGSIVILISYLK